MSRRSSEVWRFDGHPGARQDTLYLVHPHKKITQLICFHTAQGFSCKYKKTSRLVFIQVSDSKVFFQVLKYIRLGLQCYRQTFQIRTHTENIVGQVLWMFIDVAEKKHHNQNKLCYVL